MRESILPSAKVTRRQALRAAGVWLVEAACVAGLWFFGDGQPASNTCPAGGAHANLGGGDYFLSFV